MPPPNDPLTLFRALERWLRRTLLDLYVPNGATVLDLMCGRGGDLVAFCEGAHITQYVGMDPNPDDVNASQTKWKAYVEHRSAAARPSGRQSGWEHKSHAVREAAPQVPDSFIARLSTKSRPILISLRNALAQASSGQGPPVPAWISTIANFPNQPSVFEKPMSDKHRTTPFSVACCLGRPEALFLSPPQMPGRPHEVRLDSVFSELASVLPESGVFFGFGLDVATIRSLALDKLDEEAQLPAVDTRPTQQSCSTPQDNAMTSSDSDFIEINTEAFTLKIPRNAAFLQVTTASMVTPSRSDGPTRVTLLIKGMGAMTESRYLLSPVQIADAASKAGFDLIYHQGLPSFYEDHVYLHPPVDPLPSSAGGPVTFANPSTGTLESRLQTVASLFSVFAYRRRVENQDILL